jgi:hypothetical protein
MYLPEMRRIENAYSGGGAAASPLTFSGSRAETTETAHLGSPTQMFLKFLKKSPRDASPCNLKDIIYQKLPSDKITTIEVTEDDKCFKVLISFKKSEDLEKSKSLLKTCQFLSTTKGKTSNWKPDISVVQPKKREQQKESAADLEQFPLGIITDHHLAPVRPMHQSVNKFLHPRIFILFNGSTWSIDDKRWSDIVKLQYYESSRSLGTKSYCVPHPNNPESQRQIVEMQQMGAHDHSLRNWKHTGFVLVPRSVLKIPEYWIPHCFGVIEEIQEPDPATLISPPVSCCVSPYPEFDPVAFLESLGEPVHTSVHPQFSTNHVPFWLTDAATDALFQMDDLGNTTTNLKTRYAQMIDVNAYVENPRIYGGTPGGEIFPGIKDKVTIPKHLLIMHPSSTYEILIRELKGKNHDGIGGIPRYKHVGKVLIPWQFLRRMPNVWVNFEKSPYSSWH